MGAKVFAGAGATGIGSPVGGDLVLAPLESDTPYHATIRKILHPFFQPALIERYRGRVGVDQLRLIWGAQANGV